MKELVTILGRTAFVLWLAALALFGFASLIGYPGPFILTAFSMGGLPPWLWVRSGRLWFVALVLAAVACILPVYLLIVYTGDGDFSVAALVWQISILTIVAYGLAWLGLLAGRTVWRPLA